MAILRHTNLRLRHQELKALSTAQPAADVHLSRIRSPVMTEYSNLARIRLNRLTFTNVHTAL